MRLFFRFIQAIIAVCTAAGMLGLVWGLVVSLAQAPTPALRDPTTLVVWGNRRSGIYHLPGCRSYPRTPPGPHWVPFITEADAQQAGYRVARNCPQERRYHP